MANIEIGGRLHSTATGNVVTGANEVLDDVQNKKQQEINAELIEAVGTGGSVDSRIAAAVNVEKTRAEGAESTLDGKITAEQTRATNAEEALDGRVDTLEEAVGSGGSVDERIAEAVENAAFLGANDGSVVIADFDPQTDTVWKKAQTLSAAEKTRVQQNIGVREWLNNLTGEKFESYTATDQTTAVTQVLPDPGSNDTVYRVGKWDGTEFNEEYYSDYAWDGSAYVQLNKKSIVGEVFDISEYHAGAKYADLAAALDSNNGGGVPQSLQKGGMSVKFVSNSDNKYIQYMCKTSTWSSTPADWEKINNVTVSQNPSTGDAEANSISIDGTPYTIKDKELTDKLYANGGVEIGFNEIGGINADGSDSDNTAYRRTIKFNVKSGSVIDVDIQAGSTGWCTLACYDSNGDFIHSASLFGTQQRKYTIPSGVATIRLSSNNVYAATYARFELIADSVADKSINLDYINNEFSQALNNSELMLFTIDAGVSYADGNIGWGTPTDRKITGYIKVSEGDRFDYKVYVGSTGWAAIAAYDENKNYSQSNSVRGIWQTPNEGRYVVPSGIAYIIFTGLSTESNYAQKISISTKEIHETLNAFDGNLAFNVVGGIAYETGADADNVDYVRTDYISVSEGDIIHYDLIAGSAWWGVVALYNSNKAYIQNGSISGTSANGTIIIPNGVAFIRLSCSLSYTNKYGVKNKIIRENELQEDEAKTSVNVVSYLKYPNLWEQKACIAIQMDLGYLDDAVSGHKEMLATLREYGLMSMDYAINITALQSNTDWLNLVQKEGCEIIYHNRINSPSDVSSTSTLTVEQAKEGVCDERLAMTKKGFTTFGMVANNGNIGSQFKPMIDILFYWSESDSGQIMTIPKETTKAQYLSDHNVFRTGFDMNHSSHSAQAEQDMINAGKAWIDSLITNKSMGVLYCHYYNRPDVDNYGLYENVLRGMAEYIVGKINDGDLFYGSTTECLNYLCK